MGSDGSHIYKDTKAKLDYLKELLTDRNILANDPRTYLHVGKILEKEILRIRSALFATYGINQITDSELPEPEGPKVTLQSKVYMPTDNGNSFNFVGRILGPDGSTAKCLQQCLGVKIMVRGRGSMRDRKKLGLESPISFNIEHSLDGGLSFLPFKEIEVRPSIGFISLSNNATHLSDMHKRTLIDTAKQDKLYVLRMNLSGSRFLESSLLACQLISSQFRLQLIVSLDEVGFPIGLHASASKYACPLSVDSTELLVSSIPSEFPVKIDVQKPIVGASPETTRYLQRLEKQREEMARAEKGENKSFFAKYWTYIVLGLVIFVVMSAAQEASTATGNSGGGGGGNRQ